MDLWILSQKFVTVKIILKALAEWRTIWKWVSFKSSMENLLVINSIDRIIHCHFDIKQVLSSIVLAYFNIVMKCINNSLVNVFWKAIGFRVKGCRYVKINIKLLEQFLPKTAYQGLDMIYMIAVEKPNQRY